MPYPLPVTVVSIIRSRLYAGSLKDLVIVFHNSKSLSRYLLFLSHFHFATEFLFALNLIYFVSFLNINWLYEFIVLPHRLVFSFSLWKSLNYPCFPQFGFLAP